MTPVIDLTTGSPEKRHQKAAAAVSSKSNENGSNVNIVQVSHMGIAA